MEPTTRQVVVAYDFSEHGRAVLDRAIQLAARAPFHVLHFVTVLDPKHGIPQVTAKEGVDYRYADAVRDALTTELMKAFQEARVSSELQLFVHTRIGKPAAEILGLAKEVGADLIFIGTHGHTGMKHLIMGSVAEKVAREAGCAVMIARPKTYPDIQLNKVVEVEPAHHSSQRLYRFSYSNNQVIMRPPDWPLM